MLRHTSCTVQSDLKNVIVLNRSHCCLLCLNSCLPIHSDLHLHPKEGVVDPFDDAVL